MDINGKYVLVAGCGVSGVAAAQLLYKIGAKPVMFDTNTELKKEDVLARFEEVCEFDFITGRVEKEIMEQLSLVVISPGIPVDADFVEDFRNNNLPVWGEIELAYQFAKGGLVAITGTNGKTTTTALVGRIMSDYYNSVFVVGNIGNAYTKEALKTQGDSVTVAEISSFQLETAMDFHPHESAVLNITPDHLNRHHTME